MPSCTADKVTTEVSFETAARSGTRTDPTVRVPTVKPNSTRSDAADQRIRDIVRDIKERHVFTWRRCNAILHDVRNTIPRRLIIIIIIHAFITRAHSVVVLNQRCWQSLGGQHGKGVNGLFEKISFQTAFEGVNNGWKSNRYLLRGSPFQSLEGK